MKETDTSVFWNRYSKKTIEPYAIKTIGLSFDEKYLNYYSPLDTDNFDFVSPNNNAALEATLITTENEMNAYVYEKQLNAGKKDLKTSDIKWAQIKEDGSIRLYYGGSMSEIKTAIMDAIEKKDKKARKRLIEKPVKDVDLCVCIVDGGLFDLQSFELAFNNLNTTVFNNIFFITPSHFIRFSKINNSFTEYNRTIQYT